jgi:hypothetical protein
VVTLEANRYGLRLVPETVALGVGSTLVLQNNDGSPHVFSIPALGLLTSINSGASFSLPLTRSGEAALFVLGWPDVRVTFFVSPGPYAVVSGQGRWALQGLDPGQTIVHIWHPRFPPVEREVTLEAGHRSELHLNLGIGLGPEEAPNTPMEDVP